MAVPPPRRVPRRAPGQRTGSAPRSRPPRAENGDEEIYLAPRRRTAKLNPVVAIALFASPVVLAIVIGALYFSKESRTQAEIPVETDDNVAYDKLKAQIPAAKKLYLAAMVLKDGDDQDAFGDKVNVAMEFILDLIEEYERILEPIRDEDGQVPDEYNEYMVGLSKLQMMNQDLYRCKGFFK